MATMHSDWLFVSSQWMSAITIIFIISSISDGSRKCWLLVYSHILLLYLPFNLSTDFVYLSGSYVLINLIENLLTNISPLFLMARPYLLEGRHSHMTCCGERNKRWCLLLQSVAFQKVPAVKNGYRNPCQNVRHIACMKNKLFSFTPLK